MTDFSFIARNGRWLAGGFVCTLFSSYGQTFLISLSSGHIREELSLSNGDFGFIYMIATLASAALLPYVGAFIDRVPVVRFAVFAGLGLATAMVLMAFAHSVWTVGLAIIGLRLFGQGLFPHTAFTAIGRWYSANRGRAVSIAALGHQVGEALMPLTFVALAVSFGWRGSWIAGAVAILVIALPVILWSFAKGREPQGHVGGAAAGAVQGRQWTRGEVLRDPWFYPLMAAVLAPPVIGTILFFHQVYMVEQRGWDITGFSVATPVLAGFAIVSTMVSGRLVDRLGSATLLPLMLALLGTAALTLAFWHDFAALFVFMAIAGSCFGMAATIYGALWPEIYGTKHLGAVRSMITGAMVFSTAVGPGLSGWLIDTGVSFDIQIVALALFALTAAALVAPVGRHVIARARAGVELDPARPGLA